MHWSEPYIGLPWQDRGLTREGVACWGLARLVYAEVLGLDVPDYAAEVASLEDRAEVAGVYAEGTMLGPWRAVPEADVREFDILVFRRAGLDAHVGIVVAPGRMLHITSGQDSAIVSYADGRWAPRLSSVYRHERLMGAVGGVVDGCGGRRLEIVFTDDEPSPAMVRAGEDVLNDWAHIVTPDDLARRVYAAMVGAKA